MATPPLKSHYPAIVHELMARLRAMEGEKQVIVQVGSKAIKESFIDVTMNENGDVGYLHAHERHLMDTMGIGLLMSGDVIVMQKIAGGEINVFGAELHKGACEFLSGDAMAHSHETDPSTGETLPHKPGIHFPEWPAEAALAPQLTTASRARPRRA